VQLRVVDFDQLLTLALTEIIRYGADAPQVVRRLGALLDELEAQLAEASRAVVIDHRELLAQAVASALPAPFSAVASTSDRRGLG
jgi:uncharacterized membrane protein